MTTDLSVIIPVRGGRHRDIASRLAFPRLDPTTPEGVEFIVVDEGSRNRYAREIERACTELGLRYLRLHPRDRLLNLARARNAGAGVARGRLLLFQDVDLMPHPGFYEALLKECAFQGLNEYENEFLVLPVAYLTEAKSSEFLAANRVDAEAVYDAVLKGDTDIIENFAPVSSAVVVPRAYYLLLGGQNEAFQGWGYEDWEFAYRLVRNSDRFPRPANFDTYWRVPFSKSSAFEGWRSLVRLYGDLCFRRKVFLSHAYHQADETFRTPGGRLNNERLFDGCCKETRAGGLSLEVPTRVDGENALFVGWSPFLRNRALRSAFASASCHPYSALAPGALVRRIRLEGVDRVVLDRPGPDPNEHHLYGRLREEGVPLLAVYRYGLSDCVFLDETGFPPDSQKFRARLWDRPLDDGEEERVLSYIAEETAASTTAFRALDLKHRLKLKNKNVLLATFGTSEMAAAETAGEGLVDSEFRSLLQGLAALLDGGWIILADDPRGKPDNYASRSVLRVDKEDPDALIAVADVVLCQAEDSAIRALLQYKPVVCTQRGCIEAPTAIRRAAGIDEVYEAALRPAKPEPETVLRLLHHMRFGVGTAVQVTSNTGHPMVADTVYRTDRPWAVRYTDMRLLGQRRTYSASAVPRMSSIVSAQLHDSVVEWNVTQKVNQPYHDRPLALALMRGRESLRQPTSQATAARKPSPPAPPVKGTSPATAANVLSFPGAAAPATPTAKPAAPTPAAGSGPAPAAAATAAPVATVASKYRSDPVARKRWFEATSTTAFARSRKWAKFRRDPQRFFGDSPRPLVRSLGAVYLSLTGRRAPAHAG